MRRKTFKLLLFLCPLLFAMGVYGQNKKTVIGKITDSTGQPIGGVAIELPGKKVIATTNDTGGFVVSVPEDIQNLHLEHVSYVSKDVNIGSDGTISVVLTPVRPDMDEVVVTSLGIKRQVRSLGYAVSQITAKDLTETGATNVASALYGKAAGVKIVTPPGGATTAVSVQIRGVSSIGLNTQPLYVVDGVPIRLYNDLSGNLGNASNNNGYWSNTQIQSNGILDINPDDIASMTILKGASASALYGSEATNGVVVITTKKGIKGKGLGVDFNYVLNQEKVAYGPDYQNEYGPGDGPYWGTLSEGTANDLFVYDADGAVHPFYATNAQFGPKFDGRQVKYWDGSMRSYNAQPDNWKDFYQTGFNSTANIAVQNGGEQGNYRFSYTRMDYKGIMPGSKMNKNNFNFNGTLNLSKSVSLDIVSQYNNTFTHNRPYQMGQIFGSYGGFFSRFDDMNVFKTRYQTTNGYKYVLNGGTLYDADQAFAYGLYGGVNLFEYFWTALKDINNETQNRFLNTVTLNVAFSQHLKFRGRVGGDMATWNIINQNHNTQPAALGATGQYAVASNSFNRFYGDALMTYNNKINSDLDFSILGGVNGRKDVYRNQYSSTTNGLVNENFFSLSNSAGALTTTAPQKQEETDVAAFGTINFNYKNLLFLEGTGRYEGTSTLPPGVNNYFYPSINASFVLSDAVKLPDFFSYAKVRASYGLVGNHPNIYQANVAYLQNGVTYNGANVIYQSSYASSFGNNDIKSEKKRELEFGLETRVLNNLIGVDISYYNNKVHNQILTLSTSTTIGASSVLGNQGDLANYGIEAAFDATPIANKNFKWVTRFNFAVNKNKLTALPNGLPNLTLSSQDGGYAIIRANVGDPLGNIYVHPIATDDNGNKIIENGFYKIVTDATDPNYYKYVGNIMPKVVGGFVNTVSYKQFTVDFTFDYRMGGNLLSIPTYYQTGAGMYKNTLQYRDAASGGQSYDIVSNKIVPNENGAFHDGIVLKGVNADGTANTTMIDASRYYQTTYNWETTGAYENAVFKNSYIKFRELAVSYNLPKSLVGKMHFQKLSVSLIGRNLFYIWKTLPHGLDPEIGIGSSWLSQGIDGGNPAPTRSLGLSLKANF
ncbi:MAG: SusC/RagA family TonB-linked outer membrane protein [Pseudopedobacter saltans]|uniref:SusC/RagA family TonB-linked outer membrane protein n=1 Tax=Pseudopedobacter saltans TaxID=151895 RepID=A0A2W5ETR7_9SPHI|nr:MAG: SusC/RagA family TonB-linked outer membrane protein [Pseudopedobacter saltans]